MGDLLKEFAERQDKARNMTLSSEEAEWFVNYNIADNTTAVVVTGSDGIGVFFIVLKNNHLDEFKEITKRYLGWRRKGCLGECIRYASQHGDLIPEKCTIGGVFSSKLRVVSNQK